MKSLRLIVAGIVCLLILTCGCASQPGGALLPPVSTASFEVNDKGLMTITTDTPTLPPKSIKLISGAKPTTYVPKEDLDIPWKDIMGIATVTLIGAAAVGFWMRSKTMAAVVVALGLSGIGGIVFWEIKWYILCVTVIGLGAWLLLPRLKETLGGE